MAGPVRIAILADGSRARREMGQTARSGRSLGSVLSKAGRTAALGLSVGLLAATASAGKLAVAAAEDETSVALLTRTIDKNTDSTTRQIAANERWITSQGKLFGVTDDELRPALATLVTATKDLGRAQDLASLAMDVAAGRGKSLESVSTALMKAENGQVSALARLGINTKTAKGETIGMDTAVRRMAKTFGGAAAAKAGTLQGRIDRLKVMATEAGEAIGYKLLPPLSDLAFKAADGLDALEDFSKSQIQPRLEDLAGWVRENKDEFRDLAGQLKDKLVPVLREGAEMVTDIGGAVADASIPVARKLVPALGDLLDVVGDVLEFVNDLPGPVKEIGIQAGVAALVLPRLAAAATSVGTTFTVARAKVLQFNAEMTYAETRSQRVQGALSRMGGAARTAAGVGGLAALAQGAGAADRELGTLMSTLGGAAVGFSLGGPIGAAVGALGGLVLGLSQSRDETAKASTAWQEYAAALDGATGAMNAQTRATIYDNLQKSGALDAAAQLGVSQQQLVSAAMGRSRASQVLSAALDREKASLATLTAEMKTYRTATATTGRGGGVVGDSAERDALEAEIKARQANIDAIEGEIAASAQSRKELAQKVQATKRIPRSIVTRVQNTGLPKSVKEFRDLTRGIKLTPRQVRTVVQTYGTKLSEQELKRLRASLKKTNETKIDLRGAARGIDDFVRGAQKAAGAGAKRVSDDLERPIRATRPDLSMFRRVFAGDLSGLRENASTGGRGIAANLKSGLLSGMYGTGPALSAIMSAAVRDAIAAARAEARSNSPSKETMEIGGDLGNGLVIGVRAKARDARKGGRDIVRALLEGVTGGTSGVDQALGKLTALIEKRIKGKDEAKRERAVLRGLKDEYQALRKNGQAQDKNTRRLEAATSRYKNLVQAARQYAATIKQGFVDYGNIVGLGVRDGSSSVSLTGLLSQLQARAAASERFAALIQQLRGAGASQTTIQQLLDAGVEGGLATAEAIASGGAAAITQINALTSQIASTGSRLGEAMRKAYKQAGISAAQATVEGLKKRQRQLDRVAEQMAGALAKQLRKELGIKGGTKPPAQGDDFQVYSRTRTPALDAYRRGAGGPPQKVTFELKMSAAEVSQFIRGKEFVADADYYFKNGGTTQTIVKRGTTS